MPNEKYYEYDINPLFISTVNNGRDIVVRAHMFGRDRRFSTGEMAFRFRLLDTNTFIDRISRKIGLADACEVAYLGAEWTLDIGAEEHDFADEPPDAIVDYLHKRHYEVRR